VWRFAGGTFISSKDLDESAGAELWCLHQILDRRFPKPGSREAADGVPGSRRKLDFVEVKVVGQVKKGLPACYPRPSGSHLFFNGSAQLIQQVVGKTSGRLSIKIGQIEPGGRRGDNVDRANTKDRGKDARREGPDRTAFNFGRYLRSLRLGRR
jgi:hypothetical protein